MRNGINRNEIHRNETKFTETKRNRNETKHVIFSIKFSYSEAGKKKVINQK